MVFAIQSKFPPSGKLQFSKNYTAQWHTDSKSLTTVELLLDGARCWMGIGFSSNKTMVGSEMFIIAEFPNSKCSVKVYEINPAGYAPPVVSSDQSSIKDFHGAVEPSKVSATFIIDNMKIPNAPYILWASCDTNNTNLTMSYHSGNKGITNF